MNKETKKLYKPSSNGRFGKFGGKFVPETLMSSLKEIENAFWWTIVTITTVGYGDYAPQSFYGRVLAIFLMLAGIGLVSTVTGITTNPRNIINNDSVTFIFTPGMNSR